MPEYPIISTALSVASVLAQLPPTFYQPLYQVQQFFQLSDSQLQAILSNNDAYNEYASRKQNRIQQVQREIAAETAKSPLAGVYCGYQKQGRKQLLSEGLEARACITLVG